jgi:cytochrome o ubiquinol oxidase subunit 3
MATIAKAGPNTRLWNAEADEHDTISTRTFGFWLYMLSDALIFTSIFASYAVLSTPMNLAGGPGPAQVTNAVEGFWQTLIILGSVFAYSQATVALKNGSKAGVAAGILVAMALGVAFVSMGWHDLAALTAQGNGYSRSAYLSIFFTLIATHGLHMGIGILWMLIMLVQIARFGFTADVVARLLNLRMFWQFQATIWVLVYVYVYLLGGAA